MVGEKLICGKGHAIAGDNVYPFVEKLGKSNLELRCKKCEFKRLGIKQKRKEVL